MDDTELGSAIRELAEPRPPHSGARDEIVGRVATKRRRRRVGLGVAAVAVVGAVAVGAGHLPSDQRATDPTTTEPVRSVSLTVGSGPYGFFASMDISFPDDRKLMSGVFELDGTGYPASFYVNDGTDSDVRPDPLPLTGGVTVTSGTKLSPDCSASTRAPELVLTSRLDDGSVRVDRFGASNQQTYAAAVEDWCATGVQVTVMRASGAPDGNVTAELRVVNPGTDPVTVTSDAYDVGDAHWNPASITIPPGGEDSLVIRATHSTCGADENPWTAGLLKGNGQVIEVYQGDQWC